MGESIQRGGAWWHQQSDNSWLRWNDAVGAWERQPGPPPPPPPPAGASRPYADAPDVHPSQTATSPGSNTSYAGLPARFQPLSGLAPWLIIALAAAGLAGLVGILSSIGLFSLLSRAASGEVVMQADFDAAVSRENLIAIVRLLVEIPASILFIFWFHRAYTNLTAFGAAGLPYSPGWAVGAWFVPFLNLLWPKRMMDAIWKASEPGAPLEQGESWRSRRTPSLLTWWWFLLIAMVIFAANWGLEGETIEQVQRSTVNLMVRDLMRVAAWLVTLYVVREVTSRQEQRARGQMRR